MNRNKEPQLNLRKLEGSEIELDEDMAYPFHHPARIAIQGMTNSGKSVFITKLIQDLPSLLNVDIAEVFYCHPDIGYVGETRSRHIANMQASCAAKGINFTEIGSRLTEFISDLKKNSEPRVVILDDLERRLFHEDIFIDLFDNTSHNFSVTIIFTFHNFFYKGRTVLTLKRAVSDWIIWPTGYDPETMQKVSRNLLGNPLLLEQIVHFLNNTFDHVWDRYVYIDKTPNRDLREDERKLVAIRTNLFKDKEGVRTVIYLTFDE
jgi:hypothetical protein